LQQNTHHGTSGFYDAVYNTIKTTYLIFYQLSIFTQKIIRVMRGEEWFQAGLP